VIWFFGRKKQHDIVVIFDIGSSSVGGALVAYEEDAAPRILFSARSAMQFKKDFDFEHFYAETLRSLEKVAHDVLESLSHSVEDVAESLHGSSERATARFGRGRIKDVYCIFSSPWYAPNIVDVRREYEEETLITPEVILELTKRAAHKLKRKYNDPRSVHTLEERILEYRLNGYRIADPLSLRATSADIKLYTTFISKKTSRAVKAPIQTVFSFRKIHPLSFLLVMFSFMRDIHPDKRSFMTLDLRGEVAEVGIVYDDVLIHTFSFPYGKHTLVRNISAKLNVELFEAVSALSLFSSGTLNDPSRLQIGALIDGEIVRIKDFLKANLGHKIYLPSQVYVLVDRDMELIAERALRAAYEGTHIAPEVAILSDTYFREHLAFSKQRYEDRFLALGALYLKNARRNH
jgi:hypothetical protein